MNVEHFGAFLLGWMLSNMITNLLIKRDIPDFLLNGLIGFVVALIVSIVL